MTGIRGYQETERTGLTEIYHLHSTAHSLRCPCCRSEATTLVKTGKSRDIRGLSMAFKRTMMRVYTRRILCRDCGHSIQEPIDFCAAAYASYSKWVVKFVLALRRAMSIREVAQFTGLNGESVKNIEHKAKRIKAVAIDMANAYSAWVGEVLSNTSILKSLKSIFITKLLRK